MPLHSSLGNNSETPSQKKKEKKFKCKDPMAKWSWQKAAPGRQALKALVESSVRTPTIGRKAARYINES